MMYVCVCGVYKYISLLVSYLLASLSCIKVGWRSYFPQDTVSNYRICLWENHCPLFLCPQQQEDTCSALISTCLLTCPALFLLGTPTFICGLQACAYMCLHTHLCMCASVCACVFMCACDTPDRLSCWRQVCKPVSLYIGWFIDLSESLLFLSHVLCQNVSEAGASQDPETTGLL